MRILIPVGVLVACLAAAGCGGGDTRTAEADSSGGAAITVPPTATPNPSVAYLALVANGLTSLSVQFRELAALFREPQLNNTDWVGRTTAKVEEITRMAQALREAKAPSTPEWQRYEETLDKALDGYIQAMPFVEAAVRTGSSELPAEAFSLMNDATKALGEANALMPKE